MENLSLNNDASKKPARVVESTNIFLLEEKLVVNRLRQKVGEVIVRKEIETRMVHIPIRRERLLVEKSGTSTECLAEVDLGEGEINGVKFSELGDADDIYQVQSNFVSLEVLQKLLAEITSNLTTDNVKLRLEIITDRPESQQVYQDICDRN